MGGRPTQRERRAIALIAIAATVLVVAGLAYLRPALTPKPGASPPPTVNRLQVTGDFVTYDFLSPSVGWALDFSAGRPASLSGLFWVFRTADRGAHWRKQLTGQAGFAGFGLGSIQVISQSNVFLLVRGVTDQFYRTTDGGTHWSSVALPRTQIQDIEFLDSEHGWLFAQPTPDTTRVRELYATHDAGDS